MTPAARAGIAALATTIAAAIWIDATTRRHARQWWQRSPT